MTETHWKKVNSDKASDLLEPDALDASALQLLQPDMRPEAFIEALSQAEKWPEAIKVMARTLPAREAVWWACVCTRQTESLTDEQDTKALEAAEEWVYKPTEENREKAFNIMLDGNSDSPASFCASAAVLSAGNLPVQKDQHVELDKHLFPTIIDSIVMVSASEKNGQDLLDRLQLFLRSGEDIARGGNGSIDRGGEKQ